MANEEHVALLKQGVAVWNEWREQNPQTRPDLEWAYLQEADCRKANLSQAELSWADLCGANLSGANLFEANLCHAKLSGAKFLRAHLLTATFSEADLSGADLTEANMYGANLFGANLSGADLDGADLNRADLNRADLSWANLAGAKLSGANLQSATLVESDLTGADITSCPIYGISAWGLKLDGAKQQNLIISLKPEITVDNIEVAQFIYLLLHNQKIRDVIDTITSKAVLILGRFTPERKAILDALREELRNHNYVPILFDFEKTDSQDFTATVSTLANMARFIIADLTDPSSIPYELATVVPNTPVPVQPILLSGKKEFAMFVDLRRRYHWVLDTHRYNNQEHLIANISERVIRPAELKVLELRGATAPATPQP